MNTLQKWDDLCVELNDQTGLISWAELERHFARGVIPRVAESLDLVIIGATMVRNDTHATKE